MKLCPTVVVSIFMLLGNYIGHGAATTGPAPGDTDGPGLQKCPACSHRSAGTSGLPGNAYNPGSYGRVVSKDVAGAPGKKGDVGLTGAVDKRGTPGNHGPKGDSRIGLPDKSGPKGPPHGTVDEQGASGSFGPKGDDGTDLTAKRGLKAKGGPKGERGVNRKQTEPGDSPDKDPPPDGIH